ncbi:hypothetical protein O3P69_003425 [Scylla paramamosain]|uniref:MADF domain-containing protein n=1 Tax=Scylla paramamosain TaxID=85552 RepID=A0AAW0UHZ4_SCYPA
MGCDKDWKMIHHRTLSPNPVWISKVLDGYVQDQFPIHMARTVREWFQNHSNEIQKKVRTQEVLWDVKHGNYSKKVLERAIWNEICQELKAEHSGQTSHPTTDPVMGKFTYLRETIRSYCKKQKRHQVVQQRV